MQRNRRHVRCTICTKHRWRGNAEGRYKPKEEARRKRDRREVRNATQRR